MANHYRLKKLPEITIYQYAFSIVVQGLKPDRRIPIRLGRCIMASEEVEKALGAAKKGFVCDGTNLFFPLAMSCQLSNPAPISDPVLRISFHLL